MSKEPRDCKGCHGTGITVTEAWTCTDSKTGQSKHYPRSERRCTYCDGRGKFWPVNVEALLAAIKGRKGLRSAAPKPRDGSRGYGDSQDHRAYYVWRMARFHGGEDVTMPMTAAMLVHHDPFLPELDKLADAVAKRCFGTDLAAAHRWGRALGHLDRDMPGLPRTAYQGNQVLNDGVVKPEEELPELI